MTHAEVFVDGCPHVVQRRNNEPPIWGHSAIDSIAEIRGVRKNSPEIAEFPELGVMGTLSAKPWHYLVCYRDNGTPTARSARKAKDLPLEIAWPPIQPPSRLDRIR